MASNLRIIGSTALDLGISVVAWPVALFVFGLIGGPIGALIQVFLISGLPVWYAVLLVLAGAFYLSSNYSNERFKSGLQWAGVLLAVGDTLLLASVTTSSPGVSSSALLYQYYQPAFAYAACAYGTWRFREKRLLAKQSK